MARAPQSVDRQVRRVGPRRWIGSPRCLSIHCRTPTRTGSSPPGSGTVANDRPAASFRLLTGRGRTRRPAGWRGGARCPPGGRRRGRSRATSRKPCAVHGPIPGTSVNVASTSSSDMRAKASSLSRPLTKRSASARSVAPFRCETALEAPANSWPAAPRPTGDVLSAPRDARGWCVARTESCWPATWKVSVPNESSGGSSFVQARGRKSGRSSISLARTGSARRRNARARGSATALTTAVRLPPARARRAGRRARTSRRGGRRRYRRSASR